MSSRLGLGPVMQPQIRFLERVGPRSASNEDAASFDVALGHGVDAGAFSPWARPLVDALPLADLAEQAADACLEGPLRRYSDDARFAATFRTVTVENLRGFGWFLRDSRDVDLYLSSRWADVASLAALLHVRETDLQEAARIGARVVLDWWIADVGRVAASGLVDVRDAVEEIRVFTHELLSWQDRLLTNVASALAAEQQVRAATRVSMRRELLRRVVACDDPMDEAETSASLMYEMALHHCALVLRDCTERRAREVGHRLRTSVGVSASVTLPRDARRTALWLGRVRAWTPRELAAVHSALHADGLSASIGRFARGMNGFRSSLRDAERAEQVRGWWGDEAPAILNFDDVSLEALLLNDPAAAKAFVLGELAHLATDTPEIEKIRSTVLVWFTTGRHASAAAVLGIHEHTVRNRVRRAESLIGHGLASRRTEVQVALRLHRVLGSSHFRA